MNSIRKWLYKPKKTDKSLLAQFYFADEDLNRVAAELDSFDSRKDPERCQALVTQLRACQDKVLTIVQRMMVEAIPYARTSRDFRVKFPDDVVQENLAGQLWFGAECLAAGSSIMNREIESAAMRPLARALTKNLDSLRHILRDQCLVNINEYTERIREALTIFDKLFAEFELSYVSAMVPVKSVKEYETIQEITVLFSETVIRAQSLGYITTDMIDEYDPALMFTIPRLAIVCGLLLFLDGPLNPDSQSWNMSDMFRPFQTLLYKIRELLFTLSVAELSTLERALCSQEEPDFLSSNTPQGSNNTSSSSSTITTTSSTTPTTTTTTGVQTDSPVLKKVRPNNDSSCSSLDKLGSDCSDSLSLPVEPGQRTGCMEDIVCQSDRAPDAPSPDAVFCESESVTVEPGQRTCCMEDIVCQSDRAPDAPSPDAVFCESESVTMEPRNTSSSLRQERNLNKSDSNDSGLHSDVISTSDSQFTISSSDSIQLLSNSALPSPLLSPSMDEVVELCMEQAGNAETSADDNHRSCEEGLNSFDQGKDTECSNSMECAVVEKSAADSCQTVCGSAAAGKEEDDDDEEEENFYTPSSGVSPLHQPSSESAAVKVPELAASQVKSVAELLTVSRSSADTGSASHSQGDAVHEQTESVNKYTGDVEGRSDSDRTNPSGFDDEDDNKENCGQRVADLTMSSCSAEDVSHLPAQQLRGVLQKVQAIFAPDESETVEAHAMGSGGSDLSDSPLTDATLTDLTPQAHLDAMLTGSADLNLTAHNTPHVHLPPRDDTSLALPSQTSDCATVSRCDTDNGACTLKASCDIEPQNQNIPSETGCVSHAGATNLDANCTENAGGCDTSAEMNRCDRCTQTPHSAINNDQSSKIHHHHHHHRRQHSNPSTASSASSLSPHRTPKGTTNKKQDKSKKRDDKTESSKAHRSAAANSNSTTQTGNLQSVEKSQQVGGGSKKSLGGKTSKTSHKTQTHKCQGLKSQRDAAGSEARLKQYADNWSDCSSHSQHDAKGRKKKEKKLAPNVMETSSGSSCEGSSSTSDCESDQDSCGSSETSSYNSESHDDEEIALAVQAAELANRNQARARFRSSSDMIHRLFVCISGVADQLQTNFAGDLRNILRVVFNLNCSEPVMMEDEKSFRRYRRRGARFFHQQFGQDVPPNRSLRDAPTWIPDDQSPMCMSCKTPFTFVRRRHHCRNCGKIFCGRCSSNAVSLPHFGHTKPVRVCNHCFVFQVNPFAVQARV